MYIKELWGLNPINPATTDIKLLSVGARSEQSSTLALNSCLLMSSGTLAARAQRRNLAETDFWRLARPNSELPGRPLGACQALLP